MPAESKPIIFRLSTTFADQLAQEAAKRKLSPNRYARQVVVDALNQTEATKGRQELAELRATVEGLREDLATAVTALLVRAGKAGVEEAKEWVKKTLLR